MDIIYQTNIIRPGNQDEVYMNYWLFKSEPSVYSIDDLQRDKKTSWEGVRNFQARNFLKEQVKKGDLVFFYHSNVDPPGIAGIAEIVREGYPDHNAFDPKHKYYDSKSKKDKPLWYMVDVGFVRKFDKFVSLTMIKEHPALQDMIVTKRGVRLSIQPVKPKEWEVIMKLAGEKLPV